MAITNQRIGPVVRQISITVYFALLASFHLFGAANVDELVQKVEKRYNSAHTLKVRFTEEYRFAGRTRPPESGELVIKKMGKMRWDYSLPKGKLFLSDGKSVILYTSGDNRVEKVPLKSTDDMRAPLAFLLGRLDLKKEFANFEVHAGQSPDEWLEATARSARTPYSGVRMLIGDNGQMKELEITGRDGSVVDYHFAGERLNVPVPDSLFQFHVPAGAQVVDGVDVAGQGS